MSLGSDPHFCGAHAMDVPNASPGHILLIAQDVAIAKGVCADLDAAGLRCTFARTCAHAREFIIRHGVDLILLDRTVLATAGDCWCELRGHQETRLVPILAFSQQAGASNIATQAKTFTALGPVPGRLQIHGIILDRIAQRVSYERQGDLSRVRSIPPPRIFSGAPGAGNLESRAVRKLVGSARSCWTTH